MGKAVARTGSAGSTAAFTVGLADVASTPGSVRARVQALAHYCAEVDNAQTGTLVS